MNGIGNSYPMDLLLIAFLISIPIIYFQYPIIIFKKNWLYRALIFYLSMNLFLFIFGIILSWNEYVGGHEIGSWAARLDAGFRMIFFGQLFGGLIAFILILCINLLLIEYFLKKK